MRDVALSRPVPKASTARAPLLDGLVSAEEAFCNITCECLAHASANVPAIVEARDSEGLHQFRIGLRRLRTALSTFGKGVPELVALGERAKALTLAVGPARDLDVFLDTLLDPAVEQLGPQQGFEILRSRALRARDKAWVQAFMALTNPELKAFLSDVAVAASANLWAHDSASAVNTVAPLLLSQHWKRAKKRARTLSTPPQRHRLRIALKKLRYTTEFFAPLYKESAVARVVTPLKTLLDGLGHLNDVAQVRSIVGRLIIEESGKTGAQHELSHCAGLLVGWHQAHAEADIAAMHKRWKALKRVEKFWT